MSGMYEFKERLLATLVFLGLCALYVMSRQCAAENMDKSGWNKRMYEHHQKANR